jgi:glycosyltransferase involved in cell wall biosynthesis
MAKVCVIRQGFFPLDPQLTKRVDALVSAGHEVDLICSTRPGQKRVERSGALTIHRLPIGRGRGNPVRYLYEFTAFLVAATLLVSAMHLRRRYALVQVHAIPDWLVFAAFVPRLFGARVILELQECMPEFLAMKYGLAPAHPFVGLLGAIEQASIAFADVVITCTDQMRERFIERGAAGHKIGVILLSANEETFDPDRFTATPSSDERFVLIFHGTIEESFGVDTVVRAVALLKNEIPGLQLKIFGDGTFRPRVTSLIRELGLEDRVWSSAGWAPLPELVSAIASADAGLVPTRHSAFRDLTHSTKLFDLVAMRKPAIVARLRSIAAYFDDSCLQYFESGNANDLARAIRELHADPERRRRLAQRATEVSEPYRWTHQRENYLRIVERLLAAPGTRGAPLTAVAERGDGA